MLKKRIIASVIVKDGIVVQSIGFRKHLPLGRPEIAVEFLANWGIDEIVLLDISASKNQSGPDFKMLKKVAANCNVPLTVGGGITNVEMMRELMHNGADKISLNRQAILQPDLISQAASIFGEQCVIVSVDAIRSGDTHLVYDYYNGKPSDKTVEEWLKKAQEMGAGEIFLNSVDQDGCKTGFDTDLIRKACETVSVPVIACGGAGKPEHFLELFTATNTPAACAGNYFHYTEHSVTYAKAFLKKHGLDIRLDTYAHYKDFELDADSRLAKRDETYLEKLQYEIIPKETI